MSCDCCGCIRGKSITGLLAVGFSSGVRCTGSFWLIDSVILLDLSLGLMFMMGDVL